MRKCGHKEWVLKAGLQPGGWLSGGWLSCEALALPGLDTCEDHTDQVDMAELIRIQDRMLTGLQARIAQFANEAYRAPPVLVGTKIMHAVDLEELRALINRR